MPFACSFNWFTKQECYKFSGSLSIFPLFQSKKHLYIHTHKYKRTHTQNATMALVALIQTERDHSKLFFVQEYRCCCYSVEWLNSVTILISNLFGSYFARTNISQHKPYGSDNSTITTISYPIPVVGYSNVHRTQDCISIVDDFILVFVFISFSCTHSKWNGKGTHTLY